MCNGDAGLMFQHGSTYGGNPLASRVAVEALKVLVPSVPVQSLTPPSATAGPGGGGAG